MNQLKKKIFSKLAMVILFAMGYKIALIFMGKSRAFQNIPDDVRYQQRDMLKRGHQIGMELNKASFKQENKASAIRKLELLANLETIEQFQALMTSRQNLM